MDKEQIKEYNKIPVYYCDDCFSLAIKGSNDDMYCNKCGGSTIKEINIHDWEHLYEMKYGYNYLKGRRHER